MAVASAVTIRGALSDDALASYALMQSSQSDRATILCLARALAQQLVLEIAQAVRDALARLAQRAFGDRGDQLLRRAALALQHHALAFELEDPAGDRKRAVGAHFDDAASDDRRLITGLHVARLRVAQHAAGLVERWLRLAVSTSASRLLRIDALG